MCHGFNSGCRIAGQTLRDLKLLDFQRSFVCLSVWLIVFFVWIQLQQHLLWLLFQDLLVCMLTVLQANKGKLLCPVQVQGPTTVTMIMTFAQKILWRGSFIQNWEGCSLKRRLRKLQDSCKRVSSRSNTLLVGPLDCLLSFNCVKSSSGFFFFKKKNS